MAACRTTLFPIIEGPSRKSARVEFETQDDCSQSPHALVARLQVPHMTDPDLELVHAQDAGAVFINADLHIHSHGGSADVPDASMSPEGIVDSAVRQGLSLIAITDHNNGANCSRAINHAQENYPGQVLVLAGTEISTSNGHLLVFFSPDDVQSLLTFLGQIGIVNQWGSRDSRTARSMADVATIAHNLGGVCVAAHVDSQPNGFETRAPGRPQWKEDILTSPGLWGVEIKDAENIEWFSGTEAGNDGGHRNQLVAARSAIAALQGRPSIARIRSSDAHRMDVFEHPSPDKSWTRFKLTQLSFEAFKTALKDPSARVVASVPTSARTTPRIEGIAITGGFLDSSVIHFSPNLNCLIGGRGTGKSTTLRSIAYCMGHDEEFATFDSCPQSISVFCIGGNGVRYRFQRTRGGTTVTHALTAGGETEVPATSFKVDYFGHGALARIAGAPDDAPNLQRFLDRHIDVRQLEVAEAGIASELRTNGTALAQLEVEAAELPAKEQELADIQAQLQLAQEGNLAEIAAIRKGMNAETTLADRLEELASSLHAGVTLQNWRSDFNAIRASVGDTSGDTQAEAVLNAVGQLVADSNSAIEESEQSINARMRTTAAEIRAQLALLANNHAQMRTALDGRVSDLRAQGLDAGIEQLEDLLKKQQEASASVASIQGRREQLDQHRAARQTLLERLVNGREELDRLRRQQLNIVNRHLDAAIPDYKIWIMYIDGAMTSEYLRFMKDALVGSHVRETVIKTLCERVSPTELSDLVRAADVQELATRAGITADQAGQIHAWLHFWEKIFALQIVNRPAKPQIRVRSRATNQDIPIRQLSDGQRHTILLTIAMLAETSAPLIIDQPEDDLDNAFVFNNVVQTLRSVKERRQVITATHNANIAVLGDSEQILPMTRSGDRGAIGERGSIDRTETKQAVEEILEGGRSAFARRMEFYGH